MAIGNLEAIRDWMIGSENNDPMWYTKDEVADLLNGPKFDTQSPFYKETAGRFCDFNTRWYGKVNPGASYVGAVWTPVIDGYEWTWALIVSTIGSAVAAVSSYNGSVIRYNSGSFKYNGYVWYYTIAPYGWGGHQGVNPSSLFVDLSNSDNDQEAVAKDFLIYVSNQ